MDIVPKPGREPVIGAVSASRIRLNVDFESCRLTNLIALHDPELASPIIYMHMLLPKEEKRKCLEYVSNPSTLRSLNRIPSHTTYLIVEKPL